MDEADAGPLVVTVCVLKQGDAAKLTELTDDDQSATGSPSSSAGSGLVAAIQQIRLPEVNVHMELMRLELERYDWAAMKCGCDRSSEHLADDLVALAQGTDVMDLVDHVVASGEILIEASRPALAVALAAIAGGVTGQARARFLHLVLCLIGDNGHAPGLFEGRNPVEECRELARTGLWLFYDEVLAGHSGSSGAAHAFEIVSILEAGGSDQGRVLRLQAAAAERLPWDLRPPHDPFAL